MDEDDRTKEALFRHAILGDMLSRKLRRGELHLLLTDLSEKSFEDHRGGSRQMAFATLEEWFYKYRHDGFEGLKPSSRSDQGRSRQLSEEIEQLVVDLKREDPGRSAPLIVRASSFMLHLLPTPGARKLNHYQIESCKTRKTLTSPISMQNLIKVISGSIWSAIS